MKVYSAFFRIYKNLISFLDLNVESKRERWIKLKQENGKFIIERRKQHDKNSISIYTSHGDNRINPFTCIRALINAMRDIIRPDKKRTRGRRWKSNFRASQSTVIRASQPRDKINGVTRSSLSLYGRTRPFQRPLGPMSLVGRIGMDVLKVHAVTRSTWNLRENPRSPFAALQLAAASTDRPLKSSRTISPWSMTDTVRPAPEINFPWLGAYNHLKARRPPLVLLTSRTPLAFAFLTFPTSDDASR